MLGAARAAAGARAATDAADDEAARERRRSLACANVRRGEVSRARVVLTSAAIAPGTDEAFAALSDPARRPPSPRQDVPVDLCEHYKLLLDDAVALELFVHAANLLAAAHVPADVAAAVGLSRLTALRKPGGGVRGIATSDTFRRLVSRSLARMFADTFDEATRPYQFALQTRAGTDALSGMLRAAVDLDSAATVVSLDGRSA